MLVAFRDQRQPQQLAETSLGSRITRDGPAFDSQATIDILPYINMLIA